MKKKYIGFCLVFLHVLMFGQRDSIKILATLDDDAGVLHVQQKILYHNLSEENTSKIKLLNWSAAYKTRNTPLLKRKLENRNTHLYFAKKEELAEIQNLMIDQKSYENSSSQENIFIELNETLKAGDSKEIVLSYSIKLPDAKFTGYGKAKDFYHLKYFFLVPDSFDNSNSTEKFFLDVEEHQNVNSFWELKFQNCNGYFLSSNILQQSNTEFSGVLKNDPEFIIKKTPNTFFFSTIDGQKIRTEFSFPLKNEDLASAEFYLPLHYRFLKSKLGTLPEKIFVTEKFKNAEDFVGNDDIKFWKFKFQMFTDPEKIDLDFFSVIAQKVVENTIISDKISEHWLKNGLKTYLEIQYLKTNYKQHKLLGNLVETSLLGIKPLKITYASKLKLTERYGLAYQYMMTQNLDQKINENYQNLSNFNTTAISKFQTGLLLDFIAEKMNTANFDDFIKSYLLKNKDAIIDKKDFLDQLAIASKYSSSFLENYLDHKNRSNFKIKSFKRLDDHLQVKVYKNEEKPIPFKIETEKKGEKKSSTWFDTSDKYGATVYNLPVNDADKITINDEYIFPEANFRDNYLYTQGLFSNMKKPKIKLFSDVPNPEYNEIYLNPSVSFNAYDKVLVGLNFKNKSLFDEQFSYSFTPFYSTGTGKLTGSGGVSYRFMPPESFYRVLMMGVSGSYFHYAKDLSFRKFSAFSSINFTKNPRSQINSSLHFGYNYFEKDLTPAMMAAKEYGKYNLWNVGFSYSDTRSILENHKGISFSMMEDFQKISADIFYRWEFAQNKKMSFRFFGGYFLKNNTRNNTFNFGISRLSNYSFSYGLLGQSATSGILSQQFILAEGGFKSYINGYVNQWMGAVNYDTHVWKMFNLYADAGIYKNRLQSPKFIWDSGIKLRLIPDFLEVYFPVQSSLGFEPSFKDYGYRIRYTLILNLRAVTNHLRRGWY